MKKVVPVIVVVLIVAVAGWLVINQSEQEAATKTEAKEKAAVEAKAETKETAAKPVSGEVKTELVKEEPSVEKAVEKKEILAGYLPEDVMFSVHFPKLKESIKYEKAKKFWKEISKMNIIGLMQETGADQEEIDNVTKVWKTVTSEEKQSLLFSLIGGESIMAYGTLYSEDLNKIEKRHDPKAVLDKFMFVSTLECKDPFVNFEKLFETKLEKDAKKQNKATITIDEDFKICVGYDDSKLFITFTEDTLDKLMQFKKSGEKSLADSINYQYATKKLDGDINYRLYFSPVKFFNIWAHFIASMPMRGPGQDVESVKKAMEIYKAMPVVAMASSRIAEKVEQCKSIEKYDFTSSPAYIKKIASIKTAKPASLSMVPLDSLLVVNYTWLDLKNMIDYYKATGQLRPDMLAMFDTQLAMMLGVDIDGLTKALGKEFSFVLSDIQITPMMPMPKLGLFVEVKDKAVMTGVMNKVKTMIGKNLMFSEENVDGVKVTVGSIPMMPFSLCYCFHNGFLIVASDLNLVSDIIKKSKSKDTMLDGPGFSKMKDQLDRPVASLMLIDNRKLMTKVRSIAQWGKQLATMKNRDKAAEVNSVFKHVVKPVLKALSTIKAFGSYQTMINETEAESKAIVESAE